MSRHGIVVLFTVADGSEQDLCQMVQSFFVLCKMGNLLSYLTMPSFLQVTVILDWCSRQLKGRTCGVFRPSNPCAIWTTQEYAGIIQVV